MSNVLRIIDTNANRARQAISEMDQVARLALNNGSLSAALDGLGYDMARVLRTIEGLDANFDTPRDVRSVLQIGQKTQRRHLVEEAAAAGKRLSDALRAIEASTKVLCPPAITVSAQIESLRYRGDNLGEHLGRALGAGHARQWRLCVLITASLCPGGDWMAVANAVVDAGADCIQLREKTLAGKKLLARARHLVALCRPRGVSVIVNDRPDVALLAEADGVHLGQHDLSGAETRKLVGRQLLIGVSTSCLEQARAAVHDGADYCGVGPMFKSTTKRKDVIVGTTYMTAYLTSFPHIPHLAIGGITADNVNQLVAAGTRGAAVSSAICSASNPGAVVRQLVRAMHPPSDACSQ